jgi:hypothetical protein
VPDRNVGALLVMVAALAAIAVGSAAVVRR